MQVRPHAEYKNGLCPNTMEFCEGPFPDWISVPLGGDMHDLSRVTETFE